MKRLIRMMTVATATLLPTSVIVLGTGGVSSASSHASVSTAIPLPVQEALSAVAASRGSGPLTVDPTVGSVAGGVWASTTQNQSVGTSQHWVVKASDTSGVIVLGIMVANNGTEAMSGWVPGANQVSNWVFNTANASPAATYQVTVPGTTQTISQSSTNTGITPNVVGTCSGVIASPYAYGSSIYYSGSIFCNIPATINVVLRLWDFYNNSTYELIQSTNSVGVEVDYPQGTAVCNTGYGPRNAFHDDMTTNITWPPPSTPPTAQEFNISPPVPLPCNQ